MSPRIRFHPTDAISIAKVLYLIWEQSKAGLVLQQIDNPSVTRSFKPDEVVALLSAPDTRVRRGYFSTHKAVSRLRNGQNILQQCQRSLVRKHFGKAFLFGSISTVKGRGRFIEQKLQFVNPCQR